MHEITADVARNYLHIVLRGRMDVTEARVAVRAVKSEAAKLRAGFAIVNDISEARIAGDEIALLIRDCQRVLFAMGAARAFRIIGEHSASTNLQFSRTQRESNAKYETTLVHTLRDALDILGV